MIIAIISTLAVGFILYLVNYVAGNFMEGQPLKIIGIVLNLVFLLYALRAFIVLPLKTAQLP